MLTNYNYWYQIKKFLFPYGPKKFFTTTSFLVLIAFMLALRIVLQQFSITVPAFGMKLSISWLPVYVVGFLFGPIIGLIFGILTDTITYLISGGVWFWMYAIAEPIVGLIAGVFGSLYFLNKNKNGWLYKIFWRLIIYGFSIFCLVIVFRNLKMIDNGLYSGAKEVKNGNLLAILICSFLLLFLVVIEILNYFYYKKVYKKQKSKNNYALFIFILMTVVVCIIITSFILGPISQLEYLKFVGKTVPNGYIKYGVNYLLIPRILKECVKTPLYIVLLFSIVLALKTQYQQLINNARNKWHHHQKVSTNTKLNKLFAKQELKKINSLQRKVICLCYERGGLNLNDINTLLQLNCEKTIQHLISQDYLSFKVINHTNYYFLNKRMFII